MRDLDGFVELKLPELKQRERPFEYRLRDELASQGIMFVKCKPTVEGFPDRIAIGRGHMRLVEIKREGEELSETQALMHKKLRRLGTKPVVIFTGDVKLAAEHVIRALLGIVSPR